MTTIINIAIPPALLELYNRVLRPRNRYDYPNTQVEVRGTIRNPVTTLSKNITLTRARVAAAWLGDRHASGMTKRARQDFETARVNEIMARSFVAPYWSSATLVSDRTENSVPACVLDVNGVAPAYQDPARRASWCVYRKIVTDYANPPAETSPPNPSAGWYGEVAATQFQDVWFAQRRLIFQFPVNIGTGTDTPFWADVSWTSDMSASFRGNKMWASVTICPLTAFSLPLYAPGFEPARAFLKNIFMYKFPVDAAATPWSQTVTQQIPIDLRFAHPDPKYINATYCLLYVAPIPAHGRYFARNDTVQVWLDVSADAYYATGP